MRNVVRAYAVLGTEAAIVFIDDERIYSLTQPRDHRLIVALASVTRPDDVKMYTTVGDVAEVGYDELIT